MDACGTLRRGLGNEAPAPGARLSSGKRGPSLVSRLRFGARTDAFAMPKTQLAGNIGETSFTGPKEGASQIHVLLEEQERSRDGEGIQQPAIVPA